MAKSRNLLAIRVIRRTYNFLTDGDSKLLGKSGITFVAMYQIFTDQFK